MGYGKNVKMNFDLCGTSILRKSNEIKNTDKNKLFKVIQTTCRLMLKCTSYIISLSMCEIEFCMKMFLKIKIIL